MSVDYAMRAGELIGSSRDLHEFAFSIGGTEFFAFVLDGAGVLYAPVPGLLLVVDPETIDSCRDHRPGRDRILSELRSQISQLLPSDVLPQAATLANEHAWPTSLTLCLSSNCSLRCDYCYADAGTRYAILDRRCATDAIAFAFGNAEEHEPKPIVNFSGGGEPTSTWHLLVACVEYAMDLASDHALSPRFLLNTNGFLASRQADFLAAHFEVVCLSLDGPRAIHDRYRRTPAGSGSFDSVLRTAHTLVDAGTKVVFRPTVTGTGARDIRSIVAFFGKEFPGSRINLEPVAVRGRSRSMGIPSVSSAAFLAAYLEALDLAGEWDVEVAYLGVGDIRERRGSFCGVTVPNFCVLPNGRVTGCYGYSWDDDLAESFQYGSYDRATRSFRFDTERIEELRRLSFADDPRCAACVCKWQCSGECPARRIDGGSASRLLRSYREGDGRCDLHRALFLNDVRELLGLDPNVRSQEGEICGEGSQASEGWGPRSPDV